MKNILIVDDEKPFLNSLSEGLKKAYPGDFSIFTTSSARDAIDILKDKRIDLLVTDLRMPEMDGFELISHVHKKFSHLPVIVMTAYGTPEIEDMLEKTGSLAYIEKPLEYGQLAERMFELLASGAEGYIHGISLPTFLQMVELESKTCTLTIHSDGNSGKLYFDKGKLINANCGELDSLQSAYEMLSWINAEIEVDKALEKKNKELDVPLNFLILEALRIKDEENHENSLIIDTIVESQATVTVSTETPVEVTPEKPLLEAISDDILNDQMLDEFLSEEKGILLKSTATATMDVKLNSGLTDSAIKLLKEMARDIGDSFISGSIISSDGDQIADFTNLEFPLDALTPRLTVLMKLVETTLHRNNFLGDFEENVVQTRNRWILTRRLNPGFFIGLILSKDNVIGQTRFIVKEFHAKIISALESTT